MNKFYVVALIMLIQVVSTSGTIQSAMSAPKDINSPSTEYETQQTKDKNSINATTLKKWKLALKNDLHFDLDIIRRELPLFFNDKKAEIAYFQNFTAAPPQDNRIYSHEIVHLMYALIDRAKKAARQKDWKNFSSSTILAIDVSLLPIGFIPPDKIEFWGKQTKGTELAYLGWEPALKVSKELIPLFLEVTPLVENKESVNGITLQLNELKNEIKKGGNRLRELKDNSKEDIEKRAKVENSIKELINKNLILLKPRIKEAFELNID